MIKQFPAINLSLILVEKFIIIVIIIVTEQLKWLFKNNHIFLTKLLSYNQ